MSLTNPKNVITEERLSEFYQGILPYLGGMPDILANKFNRSDLYSTSEKIIGQWIDGKPLYQKTELFDTQIVTATNDWTNITTLTTSIERVVSMVAYDGSSTFFGLIGGRISNGALQIYTHSPLGINGITIKYTKTTDSPVEIGNDTDYSTTEKIVGTWIDGKPIYQKTFYLNRSFPVGLTEITLASLDLINTENVWISQAFCHYNNQGTTPIMTSLPYMDAYASNHIHVGVFDNALNISLAGVRYGLTDMTVTLQYTKTTD